MRNDTRLADRRAESLSTHPIQSYLNAWVQSLDPRLVLEKDRVGDTGNTRVAFHPNFTETIKAMSLVAVLSSHDGCRAKARTSLARILAHSSSNRSWP
jgi:hypothetical protein